MSCKHQFVNIEQVNRKPNNQNIYNVYRDEFGARVGCPLCGEIRIVWANGEVVIINKGHYAQDEETTQNTTAKSD